ncbi:MAG: hypothetical protein KF891_01175 [Rhizobacter sp.]|nr:hypothetical protein [Rhizobacter sp.]
MNLVRHTVAAWACACLFTACGGGGSDAPSPTVSTTASAEAAEPATVQLEGCVLDAHDQPRAAAVHATDEDGRLLASAASSADGVFVLRVPAHAHVTLALDAGGHEPLPLLTGRSNVSLGGCLRDGTA